MANTKDLVAKRKEAYKFIRRKLLRIKWSPPINSDEALASTLDVYLEELLSLKEGRSNPTQRLIKGVRTFFAEEVSEDDIRGYLIEPFTNA